MLNTDPFKYDVFISYSHLDAHWVQDWLLPSLEALSIRVCVDYRDFEPGAPRIQEIERAVLQSRKTLLVLTPAYLSSEWAGFQRTLVQTLDPAATERRLLPLILKPCKLPPGIGALISVDFTESEKVKFEFNRLVQAIRPEMETDLLASVEHLPVDRGSIADRILDVLYRSRARCPEGLTEQEISKQLEMVRGPLRQNLSWLEEAGLLRSETLAKAWGGLTLWRITFEGADKIHPI